MKPLSRWMLAGLAGTLALPAEAATLVERQDAQKQVEKMTVDEHHVRIDYTYRGSYTLIDLEKNTLSLVNTGQKEVVERNLKVPPNTGSLPPGMSLPPAKPVGEVKLVDKGAGPDIAGYPTVHYQITADGEVCADHYLSAEAAKVPYLKHLIETMEKSAQPPAEMVERMPPCAQAQFKIKADYMAKGLPMRSVDNKGNVMYEITKIQTDVEVPADTFEIPSGFKTMTAEEMRKKMEDIIRQHGGGHPPVPPPAGTPPPPPPEKTPGQ